MSDEPSLFVTRREHRAALADLRRRARLQFRVFLVFVLAAVVAGTVVQIRAAHRDSDRDEALRYQRCTQTAQTAVQANETRRQNIDVGGGFASFFMALVELVGESSTGTAQQRLAVKLTADQLARALQASKASAQRQTESPIPACADLYPKGFDITRRIGSIVPAVTVPRRTTPTP